MRQPAKSPGAVSSRQPAPENWLASSANSACAWLAPLFFASTSFETGSLEPDPALDRQSKPARFSPRQSAPPTAGFPVAGLPGGALLPDALTLRSGAISFSKAMMRVD